MKKSILGCLTILSLLFTRCNNQQDKLQNTNSKLIQKIEVAKLNFIGHWQDEGLKGDLVKEFINEFAFKNQEIDVNLTFNVKLFDNRNNFPRQDSFMLSQMNMPVPDWDIIYIPSSLQNFGTYLKDPEWEKKYLVDFSQIPEFAKNMKPELLTEKFKSKFGGTLPGIFLTSYIFPLWCNRDIAKKIGISVKQFNMTFDDFLGYLKAVNDYNNSNSQHIYGIYELENSGNLNSIGMLLYFSELGKIEEIMDGKFSLKKLSALEKTIRT